jgi:hypothetical protein
MKILEKPTWSFANTESYQTIFPPLTLNCSAAASDIWNLPSLHKCGLMMPVLPFHPRTRHRSWFTWVNGRGVAINERIGGAGTSAALV